jgi:cob(I)alamin adenosyltransferase
MPLTRGFIHIYTGNGKGKTTAAMGLALRAAGAGYPVCFIQFMKPGKYSEHRSLARLKGLTLQNFGTPGWVGPKPLPMDYQAAQAGLTAVRDALSAGRYRVVIADELCTACLAGLLTEKEVLQVMKARSGAVELVLTGRGATRKMKETADLVTEMREVKHYFKQGVRARPGIEY